MGGNNHQLPPLLSLLIIKIIANNVILLICNYIKNNIIAYNIRCAFLNIYLRVVRPEGQHLITLRFQLILPSRSLVHQIQAKKYYPVHWYNPFLRTPYPTHRVSFKVIAKICLLFELYRNYTFHKLECRHCN